MLNLSDPFPLDVTLSGKDWSVLRYPLQWKALVAASQD